MEQFDFSEALRRLRAGKRVTRSVWSTEEASCWLVRYVGTAVGERLYMCGTKGLGTMWPPIQRDVLATDWVEVPDGE